MTELFLLLFILAMVWFWKDSLSARERAIAFSRSACKAINAQLLDDTVSLGRFRLGRTAKGTVALLRDYRFEFSIDGLQRHKGLVKMNGSKMEDVILSMD